MQKLKKILLGILIAIVVLIVAIVVTLPFFISPLVKHVATDIAPKFLGVPVAVSNVNISVLGGRVELTGVRVGNPKGYSGDPLAALERMVFQIDLASLPGKGPITIKEIIIDTPFISYETADGKSNVDVVKANVEQAVGKKPGEEKPAEEKPAEAGRKVIIDHFQMKSGQINYRNSLLTGGKALPFALPAVELRDIGKKSGGATVMDATGEILGAVVGAISDAVVQAAGAIGDLLKGGGDAAKDALKGAGEAAGDAAKSVGDALKKLF